jgi:hypothetical protein
MIPANELRLGNYFISDMLQEKTPNNIHRVQGNDIFVATQQPEWFNPIPLTPELLEEAGFLQTSNYHPEGPIYSIKHRNGFTFKVCYGYALVDVEQNIGTIRASGIKHLHQLQNLFYALTGQELEVSL